MGEADKLCDLQYAAGRIEACPESGCPFFGDRGCALGGLRADLPSNLPLSTFCSTCAGEWVARPKRLACSDSFQA
jgi:hypothetical protein